MISFFFCLGDVLTCIDLDGVSIQKTEGDACHPRYRRRRRERKRDRGGMCHCRVHITSLYIPTVLAPVRG